MEQNRYKGQCHCGNLQIELRSLLKPNQFSVRACQCDFCLYHQALSTSDPEGMAVFKARDSQQLSRYRFALKTADFWVCRRCGVYMGAILENEGTFYSVINLSTLDCCDQINRESKRMDYNQETTNDRIARRINKWTPTWLDIADSNGR